MNKRDLRTQGPEEEKKTQQGDEESANEERRATTETAQEATITAAIWRMNAP